MEKSLLWLVGMGFLAFCLTGPGAQPLWAQEDEGPEPEVELEPEPEDEPEAGDEPGDEPGAEGEGPEQWYAAGLKAKEAGDTQEATNNFIKVFSWKQEGQFHALADNALYQMGRMLEAEPLRKYSAEEAEEKQADSNWAYAARFYNVIITVVDPMTPTDAAVRRGEQLIKLDQLNEATVALEWARDNAAQAEHRARAGALLDALRRGEDVKATLLAGASTGTDAEPAEDAPGADVDQPTTDAGSEETPAAGLDVPADGSEKTPVMDTGAEGRPTDEGGLGEIEPLETHVVSCYEASRSFTIDGKLSEEAWQEADVVLLDAYPWHNAVYGRRQRTEVRLLYDQKFLYVAFRAADIDVGGTAIARDDMEIVKDERVEIFLQPDQGSDEYYCFEINARGALLDYKTRVYRKFDENWNCDGAFVAARRSRPRRTARGMAAGEYVVEMAIPFQPLVGSADGVPNPGERWRVGFYRIDRNVRRPGGGRKLYAMWKTSGTRRPDFHRLESFGQLQFEGRAP